MCLTGLKDVEVLHNEKMEAEVGQNVTLPCTVKSGANVQISSIEWSKNGNKTSKLALYSPEHGLGHILPNVHIETRDKLRLGSLYLFGVTTSDSDTYICLITTFPQGSIRRETELKIKGKTEANACKAKPTCLDQTLQSSQDLTFG